MNEQTTGGNRSLPERELAAADVVKDAVAGATATGVRSILVAIVNFGGTLALVRLLDPHELGTAGVGLTLLLLANSFVTGGFGSSLVRRSEAPSSADLEAVLALQLASATVIPVAAFAVAWRWGTVGQVTCVMSLALPLMAYRTPALVLLERRLRYAAVGTAEVIETVAYHGWAIGTVSMGWGVWGLATGMIVRGAVGTTAMFAIPRLPPFLPRFDWARVRPMLTFGLRVQAVGLVQVVREQGVNAAVALEAGVSALGVWTLAFRILQVPFLLFNALWRVSYPAMSRFISTGADPSRILQKAAAVAAAATGIVMVPLIAAAEPFILALFGRRWIDASSAVSIAGVGLLIGAPISVALVGYLWAIGDARTPLRAVLVTLPVWAVVALPLLPSLGPQAVGIGWAVASVVEAAALLAPVAPTLRRALVRSVGPSVLSATAVAVAGRLIVVRWFTTPFEAGLAVIAAELVYVTSLLLVDRATVQATVTLLRPLVARLRGQHAAGRELT